VRDLPDNGDFLNRGILVSIAGTVALAAILGAAMFGKSRPKNTAVAENAFRFTLPGSWIPEPSSDPTRWSYHTSNQDEHLTVSLFGFTPATTDEKSVLFRKMVEMHRGVQTRMPDGPTGVVLTETMFGESGGILAARYGGIDAVHRRFRCLLLGGSKALTIFYYEALDMTESDTDTRARLIFNSIVVPK
jgi:hypothetical protein